MFYVVIFNSGIASAFMDSPLLCVMGQYWNKRAALASGTIVYVYTSSFWCISHIAIFKHNDKRREQKLSLILICLSFRYCLQWSICGNSSTSGCLTLLIEEYTVRGALLFAGWTIHCGPYSVQRIFSLA